MDFADKKQNFQLWLHEILSMFPHFKYIPLENKCKELFDHKW